MNIGYAILGLLSHRPMTGYDLKKIIQDSPFMHWSGNNNQIYKALIELLEDGLVTCETEYQDHSPPKKIYTVTPQGMEELRELAASKPEPADVKKSFLVQLAWADVLENGALSKLLADYENEIGLQLTLNREKIRRGNALASKTEREAFLWRMIDENIVSSYRNELEWVKNAREQLAIFESEEDRNRMNYQVTDKENVRYIELFSASPPIGTEQDALGLVSLCGENGAERLILHGEALSGDFFRLKTGVAGAVLQKLVNYSVKTAMVVPDQGGLGARFREFMSEANKGLQYRFFISAQEAESWLLKGV